MATPPPPNDRENIRRDPPPPPEPVNVDRMIESRREMRDNFEQPQPVSTATNPDAGDTIES